MAAEAHYSNYKKNSLKLIILLLVVGGGWLFYDGHYNQKFISEHTNPDGTPESVLTFNRDVPPYCLAGAVVLGLYLFFVSGKKIVADDEKLQLSKNFAINYDSIESIDKTFFESKGFFQIIYKDRNDKEATLKLSDRKYDDLEKVLDKLVAKIS